MADITLDGVVQNTAESTAGWSTGNLDGELFYQGSGSIGAKVGSGTSPFVHTGTARNFSLAGANEGDHIIVILTSLTAGKLDTKANGGLRIRCGSSTSVYGDWYVDGSDTKSPTTSFLPYIADPESDFDAVAGGFSLTGNPAQLSATPSFGGVFKAVSGIMGNFNNSLVDQITIGKGLQATGTAGVLQDFVDADEGTTNNRYGFITTKDGIVYCQGKLFFGTSSASLAFSDSDQVLVFQDAPVASTFYEMIFDNSGSSSVLDSWVIKSAGLSQAAFTVLNGSVEVKNGTITAFRQFDLNTATTFTDQKISNSGVINVNGATLSGCIINDSTATSALVVDTASHINNISDTLFASNTGHSIELTDQGTYSFSGLTFTGGGADGTATADIYNNSGGAITINIVGGSTPTVRNGAGATTVINNAVDIVLTDMVAGSTIQIFDLTNSVELFRLIEPTNTFSGTVNFVGPITLRIRVRNASSSPFYKTFNATGTLTSSGFNLSVNQELDE